MEYVVKLFPNRVFNLLYTFWKVSYLNLLQVKIQSVVEEAGLVSLCRKSRRQIFIASRPNFVPIIIILFLSQTNNM